MATALLQRGYTLVSGRGGVIEGTQHVIYVYSKNPDPEAPKVGSVDVKSVDKQALLRDYYLEYKRYPTFVRELEKYGLKR